MQRPDGFVTPEAVAVSVDAAGLGSRMIAALIDAMLQGAVVLALSFIVGGVGAESSSAALVIFSLGTFLVVWAYYPLFEGLWAGRTPGKRAQRLRVVRTDGQPPTIGPILVRNLLRVVDFLPGMYGVGVASMVLSRRSQRLGDLAAGTMVIRDRPEPQPGPLLFGGGDAARVDTTALTQRDYVVVRDFLQRRHSLDPTARAALAAQLSAALRSRVAGGPSVDEAFLESLVASFRDRFAAPPPAPPGS